MHDKGGHKLRFILVLTALLIALKVTVWPVIPWIICFIPMIAYFVALFVALLFFGIVIVVAELKEDD